MICRPGPHQLRPPVCRKVDFISRRQILRRWIQIHKICVKEHRDCFENPKAPLRSTSVGGGRVEESRCAEGVAKEDQAARDVERVDNNRNVAGADVSAETADMEDNNQGNEGEEESDLQQ